MFSMFAFLLKAFGYGLGLSGGFWMCGIATRYIEYYLIPFIDGRFDEVAGPKTSDIGKTWREQLEDEWFLKPFKEQREMLESIKRIYLKLKDS